MPTALWYPDSSCLLSVSLYIDGDAGFVSDTTRVSLISAQSRQ